MSIFNAIFKPFRAITDATGLTNFRSQRRAQQAVQRVLAQQTQRLAKQRARTQRTINSLQGSGGRNKLRRGFGIKDEKLNLTLGGSA